MKLKALGGFGFFCLLAVASSGYAEHANNYQVKPQVDETLNDYLPTSRMSGRITIAGSDTMQPILAKLAAAFRRWHPEVKIAVQGSRNHGEQTVIDPVQTLVDGLANARRGDGKVMGHMGSGEVRLLALARDLSREETGLFEKRYGYKPTALPIALDAVAVYVNGRNPIKGLTMTQLDAIFSKTRKGQAPEDITTWQQVGLNGAWQAAPINLYGRNRLSMSTRVFFRMHALLDGEFKDGLKEEAGSASVVLAVARDPYGIGYSSIGFQNAMVRIVPLAERDGSGYVEPTRESVLNGTYPLSRRLYLYVNKDPGEKLNPVIIEFLKFVNSEAGQKTVAEAGVYPLPPQEATGNLGILTTWHQQGE